MKKLLQALLGQGGGDPMPSLSPKELVILRMLISERMYGQELVDRSAGELKRGTVYVTLSRMEEKGFIESFQEDRPESEGGLPRRRYKITGEGERAVRLVDRIEMALAGGRIA